MPSAAVTKAGTRIQIESPHLHHMSPLVAISILFGKERASPVIPFLFVVLCLAHSSVLKQEDTEFSKLLVFSDLSRGKEHLSFLL